MRRTVTVGAESWPLERPFRISRGVKTAADVVIVEITDGSFTGRGECVPYPRYGESVDSVAAQIRPIASSLEQGASRAECRELLAPGAALNAIDCALWDLESHASGRSVDRWLNLARPATLTTALTVGLDTPANMNIAAAQLAAAPIIKVKVDGNAPDQQLQAVHAAAPHAKLIVDANEGWSIEILTDLDHFLKDIGVVLVEQPLPVGKDDVLEEFQSAVPLCADESCHTVDDLPRLSTRYQAVNIKLDKTGGLTGALALLTAARRSRMVVMTGCMVCTSLAIAPAWLIAAASDFIDLDGPLMLRADRQGGVRGTAGQLSAPDRTLWGG
ncbi:MAG: dipeptide epimerase [Gammaproteobacteria bacterium]|nr:dipeptide epimerase [Gammaproteobacteria bacterium]